MFASVGADGSVRMFDLRHLEHSTIIYEDPQHHPLLRLCWNKQDPNYLATMAMDGMEVRAPLEANIGPATQLRLCLLTVSRKVVLNWSPLSPQRIFGTIWRHFWLSHLRGGRGGGAVLLVSGGRRSGLLLHGLWRTGPLRTAQSYRPEMSGVLKLREPDLGQGPCVKHFYYLESWSRSQEKQYLKSKPNHTCYGAE